MRFYLAFSSLFLVFFLNAQQYSDFIGAGHDNGITVTTSHNQNADNQGDKTVDGFPITNPEQLNDASRFLAQATLGADYETIQMTAAMGYDAWLEEQFSLPITSLTNSTSMVTQPDEEFEGFFFVNVRDGWWQSAMTSPDMLRQRIGLAMSEIFVVSSFGSDLLEDGGLGMTNYYDMLLNHSFGNYRNMLFDVSMHPIMGFYLSHLNNPKTQPALNIHPDENYAREVMQLFSIGLYELNNDGTRKLDGSGAVIPTYDNNDIKEFAKIFTGLGDGSANGQFGIPPDDVNSVFVVPMKMYEEHHEPGPKFLLNNAAVAGGQSGMEDINAAIDNLHNHPNVGPFIGKALIQFLVSSNPSPDYVNRVANAFNDNGTGQRGDFQAVIKAILLDPEARNCDALSNPSAGKLREPIVRWTHISRALNAIPKLGIHQNPAFLFVSSTGQYPQYSPSVFNFFQPDYQPNGPISDNGFVAPVFQIHNSSSSIGYINQVDLWTTKNAVTTIFDPAEEEHLGAPYDDEFTTSTLNITDELAMASEPDLLLDRLDILLTHGHLSSESRATILNALDQLSDPKERVDMAIYLIMISPDYAILK